VQGCQIFLGATYQNGKTIPNYHKCHKIYQIARPFKNDPNWDFWFENIPSGNPGLESILPLTAGKNSTWNRFY
jgi:hypothetical protein